MKSQSEVGTANRVVREAMKSGLRTAGEATSVLRPGPGFIVIGAKRGGTTSIYNYLLEHPSIQPLFPRRQKIKGVHYYDSNYARGQRWYRSHFPVAAAGRQLARPGDPAAISGEASPYYLFHPLAAQRLATDYPGVPLILFLRNPVERAYSHYKERIENHGEPLTFEEALDAEPGRLHGEAERILTEPGYLSAEHENHSYVAQGRYLDMLPRWFSLFPREQFHIVFSEDFYAEPERVVNGVWSFLGLPAGTLRSRKRHNYQPAPEILPATRQRLETAYAEHNRGLADLLGCGLPWPAPSSATRPASPGSAAPLAGRPAPLAGTAVASTDLAGTLAAGTAETPDDVPDAAGAARWPSITVVVATRDRPELLKRAVGSIMSQAYPGQLECVVVFDQSTPTEVAAQESATRQLRVITNTHKPGLAGARNSGILSSSAELIAFCDDDDEWDIGKIRLQVDLLATSSAEFAASGVRFHHSDHVVEREAPISVEFSELVRSRVSALHPSTFVMRREALLAIGLVDEEIPGSYGEDYDLLLRAARRGPIVSVAQPLVNVYWHQQSFFAERWASIAEALGYLLEKHPVITADPRGRARIDGQIAFAQAAQAQRSAACRTAGRTLRNNPRERRAYLALAIASGVVPASSIVRLANRRGHGI